MRCEVYAGPAVKALLCGAMVAGVSFMALAEEVKLIPDDVSLLNESMFWDKSIDVRTGLGYKDNVLLSHLDPHGSGFAVNGLDVSVSRLPLDGWQFYFLATGDDTRYWRNVGTDREDTALATAQVQRDLGPNWKTGLSLQYEYQDQIVDVSTIESELATAEIQGHGFTARPFVKNQFSTWGWLQFEVPVTRQLLKAPLDNYWLYGPKLIFGHPYGRRSEITLSCAVGQLRYDNRAQLEPDGTEVPNSHLNLLQTKAEAGWQHYWDEERHWRSNTKVGFDYNRDNGPGFFNYFKYQLSQELRYSTKRWEVSAKVGASYYDFYDRLVSPVDTSKFQKGFLTFTLRGEVRLTSFLKLFGVYENEHAFANDPTDRYGVNTVSGGLDWQF